MINMSLKIYFPYSEFPDNDIPHEAKLACPPSFLKIYALYIYSFERRCVDKEN